MTFSYNIICAFMTLAYDISIYHTSNSVCLRTAGHFSSFSCLTTVYRGDSHIPHPLLLFRVYNINNITGYGIEYTALSYFLHHLYISAGFCNNSINKKMITSYLYKFERKRIKKKSFFIIYNDTISVTHSPSDKRHTYK